MELMNKSAEYKIFCEILKKNHQEMLLDKIKEKEPLKLKTTMKVGGTADYYLEIETKNQAAVIYQATFEAGLPCFILGKGSNIIVSDDGVEGLVLRMGNEISEIAIVDELGDGISVSCGAGVTLSRLATFCAENNLTGMEFASGIPGTVGGAVWMNAGAYGEQISDIITTCESVDSKGNRHLRKVDELEFDYRKSIFSVGNQELILSLVFLLQKGNSVEIANKMKVLNQKRAQSQPLSFPSAGSAFKRPEGYFAGRLIEDSGLKGYRIGDAGISEKHAGFVVNHGQTSANEIIQLMKHVRETVLQKFGVNLEPEPEFVGRGFFEKKGGDLFI